MPEEALKVHRFAAVLPEQLLTEASRHRDPVVPADQRAVLRCLGDDLAGLVHDVSHSRIALSGSTSAFRRSTRGFHVCSYARNCAQPVKPCAERLHIAKHRLALMRWGMPPPPRTGGPPVTNIRNTSSPHWRSWLKPENRCLVPFNSFAEYVPSRPR